MRTENNDTFSVAASDEGGQRLVLLAGALDLGARHQIDSTCFAGNVYDVVIDLAGVTFMDCAGYASLLLARRELVGVGGTLHIRNASDQPARLLDRIAQIETRLRDTQDVTSRSEACPPPRCR